MDTSDHYKMFKNRNYNNASQKRLAKFALIKYRINFLNYCIVLSVDNAYKFICYFSDFPSVVNFRIAKVANNYIRVEWNVRSLIIHK